MFSKLTKKLMIFDHGTRVGAGSTETLNFSTSRKNGMYKWIQVKSLCGTEQFWPPFFLVDHDIFKLSHSLI
jgi:hypothetical protein